jgi:glycosyltransferase involved in cell wall biosynthesis
VVASDTPEVGENLGECGVLIQDPAATNYARVLDALLSDKDALRKLSNVSVQTARSYSWETTLDSIEDVYKEINHDVG